MKKLIKYIVIKLGLYETFYIWVLRRRKFIARTVRNIYRFYPRTCPICTFQGYFESFGTPPRFDATCPKCKSKERHRLLFLMEKKHEILNGVKTLLHFAPEKCFKDYFEQKVNSYITADLYKKGVDIHENIEDISLKKESFDAVICSHVLEHVDDKKALRSIYRILKPGGKVIIMVPLCEGLDATYENSTIKEPAQRVLHFGQSDHVRLYGRDFKDILETAGFKINIFQSTPEQCIRYGLLFGDKLFVGEKV